MGGLGAPFILCPLSERKELIGMSRDGGRAVLTMGKNMAIRYHILEQKQETSWTSSRHWFTSRVIKCTEAGKYGAILDNNMIALWDEADTSLGAAIKMKFSDPIWELCPATHEDGDGGGDPFVVFENGFVVQLSTLTAPELKKKVRKGAASGRGCIDTGNQIIIDCAQCEGGRFVLISASKKTGRSVVRRNEVTATVLRDNKVESTIVVKMDIVGHSILPGQVPILLYLDGDGRVWQQCLIPETTVPSVVGSIGKFVSIKTPVVIRPTHPSEDGNYAKVIIYGSDPSEEGAVVLLYDIKYDIVVVKQGLKLYSAPPIMEAVGNNILIPVGLHVLVLALYTSKSMLSGVVGKHGIRTGEEVFEQRSPFVPSTSTSGWEVDTESGPQKPSKLNKKQKSRSDAARARELNIMKQTFPSFWELVQQYKTLENEGQPQALICSQILSLTLEKRDAALDWLLQTFTDNIPEAHLVVILSNLLQRLDESTCSSPNALIEQVLKQNVDSRELGLALETLDFSAVRALSVYLKCRMEALSLGEHEQMTEGQNGCVLGRSVQWLTSILDAHYTHFVLGGEADLVKQLLGVVERGIAWMEDIAELEPFIILTQQKVDFRPRPNPHSKWRTEVLTFI